MIYVCKYGTYDPEQPRISRLVSVLSEAGYDIRWVVSEGETKDNVISLNTKSKRNYIRKAATLLRMVTTPKDIIYGYMHVGATPAYIASRFSGAKFAYDYADPWRGWYFYKTKADSVLWATGRRAFYLLEKAIYKATDAVFSASYSQLEFLERQHGKKRSANQYAETIFNCPPLKIFNPKNKNKGPASKLKLDKKRVLIYSGYVGQEYGIDLLVDAMRIIKQKRKDVALVILGRYGDERYFNLLREKIEKYDLKKDVIIHSPVPFVQVPPFLNLADIGFVPFRNIFYNSVGGPNKLFEYMSCNVVPVCSDMTEFRKHITQGETGILVKPDSARSIASAVLKLLGDKVMVSKIKKRNLARVKEKYNWAVQKRKFLSAIEGLQ
tara:strand:+ start:487 stop:1629 length:1143 start_codon:yes stop_codon:yes gene_type:complete